ncbi:MAG: cytochrome c biogenesis protein ResB [Hyphomicrobiales bacterium]
MTGRVTTAAPTLQPGGFDPLRWAWKLLCNVKFALFLVGLAGFAGLMGVVLPQVPAPMRANPAARSAWIELRREDFGPLTGPMDRLELFDVFHAGWFYALWFLIIIAVTVCTVSRIRPTIRGVRHPHKTVSDRYFETAHHRADFSHPGGADAVESALRKRRYAVERTRETDGATYLFAERFQWGAYGTFLSHLALLMLLVGGLLTHFVGFDQTLVIAEGTPPMSVFATPGPNQMFVKMVDAYRGLDGAGNIVDYHSMIEVRKGDQTVTCKATVNDPCHAFGYKIHQAAFFNDIARLRITGADGRVVYDGVLDFENQTTTVPAVRLTGPDGKVLFDAPVPQAGTDTGATPARTDDVAVGLVPAGGDGAFGLGWRVVDNELRVVALDAGLGQPRELRPGDTVPVAGGQLTYTGPRNIPAVQLDDLGPSGAVVQMPTGTDGRPYLVVSGIAEDNVMLQQGQPYTAPDGSTYTFEGQVEASGISVKRDPGDLFIWIAVAMAMVGLAITFYVPRRRLWVKITPGRTYFAGIAERTTRLGRELRHMGAELGSRDALRPEDHEP